MQSRDVQIVQRVRSHGGLTPQELAGELGVSTRTLRTCIHRINDELEGAGRIELLRGAGYTLAVDDAARLEALLAPVHGIDFSSATPRERATYLLHDLLERPGWVTLDELGRIFYLSRATISSDLKLVREELAPFGLELETRPHHGVRVVGSEMGRRACLASHAVAATAERNERGLVADALDERVPVSEIARLLDETLVQTGFSINSMAYQNLVVHLAIAVLRVQEGHPVPLDQGVIDELRQTPAYGAAEHLVRGIETRFELELPPDEVAYIALHFAGRQAQTVPAPELGDEDGAVISDEAWELSGKMVECAERAFCYDFSEDIELRMNLARHVEPLLTRLRYGMRIQNPILADIRARFPLAFAMALDASSVLTEACGAAPSEDELGYLAMAFELALERQRTGLRKKNILVVCASGAGSARMLEHVWRQQFGDCVDRIVLADVAHVAEVDLAGIDYAFTTVPLPVALPIPVCEVAFFLDSAEVENLHGILRQNGSHKVQGRFSEGLFLPHIAATSKKEALDALCAAMEATGLVAPDFRALVWAREQTVPTSFGNRVAMPHPLEPTSERAFCAVGVLDAPIAWGSAEVQAIFLISISAEPHAQAAGFFSSLADLLINEEAVSTLIADQTWNTLRELLERYGLAEPLGV